MRIEFFDQWREVIDNVVRKICTDRYIAGLDVNEIVRKGTDYTSPRYSPHRIGKTIDELDVIRDYDFKLLDRTARSLRGVDRQVALGVIWERVCANCECDESRYLAILDFCNRVGVHHFLQAVWSDGQAVYDPLVLLELGEMRCGQAARLAADLFTAGGYQTRVVQLGAHVICEVFYECGWHYFDGDMFGGRWLVRDPDGSIPSAVALSRKPWAIDAMPYGIKPPLMRFLQFLFPENRGSLPYPSHQYFCRPGGRWESVCYLKTASAIEARTSRDFGWNYYRTVPNDGFISHDFVAKYCPGAPGPLTVASGHLHWGQSHDRDGDLIGYRVFVGSRSRGWNWGEGWKPEMYDRVFELPPHDVALLKTSETSVAIPKRKGAIFVTVMPFDAHGESVGRELYPMSDELAVDQGKL